MIRVFEIVVFSCLAALVTGCGGSEIEPIWSQVKIGDLAPVQGPEREGEQLSKAAIFDVYIIDIPAENISVLDDVWPKLSTNRLRFNDYDGFKSNSFSAGFGEDQMWSEIRDLLVGAGGKKIKTVSLLLPDDHADNVTIARLDKKTIFYVSTGGSMEGVTVGPGTLGLGIKAKKIPGSRGVCDVTIQPIFLPQRRSSIPLLAGRTESGEFLFTSAGFRLKMSPADFVFLGPEQYIDNQITLGGLFFSRPGQKPITRTYLIVCTRTIG